MKRLLDSITGSRPLRVAALASLCFAASVQAERAQAERAHTESAHEKMTLSAYADAAEGRSLLAKQYDKVIGALGGHGPSFKREEIAASTNLCVAEIMTHRWSEAHPACDEAIRFAKLEMPDSGRFAADEHQENVAIAYSNRAVLEWLEDRSRSAAEDLARAHALAPESQLVARNLAKLHAPLAAAGGRTPLRGHASTAAVAAHG